MVNCNFCLKNNTLRGEVIMSNEHHYFVKSEDPVLPTSGMIIVKRHVETPFELDDAEWMSLKEILELVHQELSKENPDGFNLGWNIGKAGGQEVNHAHFHVIGRYSDEPLAGKGIRAHIKSKDNARSVKNEHS